MANSIPYDPHSTISNVETFFQCERVNQFITVIAIVLTEEKISQSTNKYNAYLQILKIFFSDTVFHKTEKNIKCCSHVTIYL